MADFRFKVIQKSTFISSGKRMDNMFINKKAAHVLYLKTGCKKAGGNKNAGSINMMHIL